ncbi:neurobeachin-like isoform X7, partial [Clarias magur]
MMMMASETALCAPGCGGQQQQQRAAAGSVTGEAAAASGSACSGSVLLASGALNPAVPIRNIRTKFAVLAGLIRAGEVSDRDIAETVLNL